MRSIHHILITLAVLCACVACSTAKRVERHDYLQSGGVELRIDTTRTLHTIEVINEYKRDTIVKTVYRESSSERRGFTTLTDTIYIHKTDTLYRAPDTTAVVMQSTPWWLIGGAVLVLAVVALLVVLLLRR